jgi:Domain of unknown function (DUF5602)
MFMAKHLSLAIAGAMFSLLSVDLKAAQAHGGHLPSNPGHLPSDPGELNPSIDPRIGSNSIFYGAPQSLGNGFVRTWVKLDRNENPTDIGVSFTDSALFGLPEESDDFGEYPLKLPLLDGIDHSTFEYELLFPKQAEATPFTHLALNWNPSGHAPEGVTTVPHFDFHFNLFTPEERHAITADNLADFFAKAYKAPPAQFLPPGYIAPPMAAEPRMGVHYIDPTSPEFQRPFDRVFIYGSYDGQMAFWEPMVAHSFLLTQPNTTDLIKLPSAYPKSGYYPTAYSVNYANGEYSVSLNGLQYRSVPEPSLTIGTLVFGALSAVSLLNKKRKQTA